MEPCRKSFKGPRGRVNCGEAEKQPEAVGQLEVRERAGLAQGARLPEPGLAASTRACRTRLHTTGFRLTQEGALASGRSAPSRVRALALALGSWASMESRLTSSAPQLTPRQLGHEHLCAGDVGKVCLGQLSAHWQQYRPNYWGGTVSHPCTPQGDSEKWEGQPAPATRGFFNRTGQRALFPHAPRPGVRVPGTC